MPKVLIHHLGHKVGQEWADLERHAGYGRGFWTLIAGVVVAVAVLAQIETNRPHPTVERIPAADIRD